MEMDAEAVWGLWLSVVSYISKKDLETAIESFLNNLYEYDFEDFSYLKSLAEDNDEIEFEKIIRRFIKEHELEEEEY